MEYRIIYDDELYHYGIKGMKWGIRHDPERVGRHRTPKPLSPEKKKRVSQYMKKYGISRSEAEAAVRRRDAMLKKVAIGTAVTAGVALGTAVAIKYGREYCDDVIKAGTTMQTVHFDTDIINKGKFYTTNKKLDQIKYRGHFGTEGKNLFGQPVGEVKKQILATTSKDIKVIGNKNAEKVYKSLIESNKEFAQAVKDVNGEHINYQAFNKWGLLGTGEGLNTYHGISNKNALKAQNIFINELKNKGYGAVADFNDRNPIGKGSGFKTRANIVFDNSNVSIKSVKQMTMKDVNRDYRRGLQIIGAQNKLSDPVWMARSSAITGGSTAAVLSAKQEADLEKLRKGKNKSR